MKIIIADDHRIVREGLRWMLESEDTVQIVAEVASGPDLLDVLERRSVDVVLLDVRMPGMSGLEVLEAIPDVAPDTKVLILTMHDEPAYIRRAIELGASGYLLKSADRNELLLALKAVADGQPYLQPEATGTLMAGLSGAASSRPAILTKREQEVLQLVADGLENKQIARRLAVSESTVKTHLRSIFSRLDVTSRAEAVANAARFGLIE